jgi:hypothetical protein
MNLEWISGKIIETIPVTKRGESVFEQTVVVEMEDGKKLKIFDGAQKKVRASMIGTRKKMLLFGLLSGNTRICNNMNVLENEEGEWRYNICGQLMNEVKDRYYDYDSLIKFNTIYGDILLQPEPNLIKKINSSNGELYSVEISRLDLIEIE